MRSILKCCNARSPERAQDICAFLLTKTYMDVASGQNPSGSRKTGLCPYGRFYGNLPKTQINLNRWMSASACYHQSKS